MTVKKKNSYSDFSSVWLRIQSETGINKITQLAEIIGTSQSNVSKKKKEDVFPPEWAYVVARKYNLLTEWLMTGEGPRRLSEANRVNSKEEEIFRGDLRDWLAERIREDPDFMIGFTARCAVYFPEFAEWLKKKETAGVVQGDNKRQII